MEGECIEFRGRVYQEETRVSLRGFSVCIAAMLAAFSGTALADETVVVRGQVTSQSGTDILFGSVGSNLVGQTFSVIYQVYDSNPLYQPFTQTFDPPYGSSVSGGYDNGTSPVFASITVGSKTYDDSGLWTNGQASRQAAVSGTSEVYDQAEDANWGPGDLSVWTKVSSTTDPFVTNFDYRANLVHEVTAQDLASGELTETYVDPANPFQMDTASLGFTPTSIAVMPISTVADDGGDPPGVPEPATWTLLIMGAAFAGGALRRRTRVET